MFIDTAKINVTAGKGGDGAVAWRREKFEPAGGPAGGDGGKGGSIILTASEDIHTLMDFRYKRVYKGQNGENGRSKKQFGDSSFIERNIIFFKFILYVNSCKTSPPQINKEHMVISATCDYIVTMRHKSLCHNLSIIHDFINIVYKLRFKHFFCAGGLSSDYIH